MKRRTVLALMTALTLSISLSACGSTPTSSNNSNSTKIEELEQRIEELEAENKELKAQLNNTDSANSNLQSASEADSLLQTTIQSPETSGVCGANLTWYYQNGVLAITGTGEMTDYSSYKDTPWYDLRDKIGWVIIDEGATTIGNNAFYNFSTLSKAVLPDTLTIIGEYAFDYCKTLEEVNIPNSVISIEHEAFNNCDNLTTIKYNDLSYSKEDFIDLAKELHIGDSPMFGWEAAAPAE